MNETNDFDGEFHELAHSVGDAFEQIGMYMMGAGFHLEQPEPDQEEGSLKEKLLKGEHVMMTAGFRLGDVAFSDRILYPVEHKADKEFKMVMPAEDEILAADLLDRIKRTGSLKAPEDDAEG